MNYRNAIAMRFGISLDYCIALWAIDRLLLCIIGYCYASVINCEIIAYCNALGDIRNLLQYLCISVVYHKTSTMYCDISSDYHNTCDIS